MTQPSSSGRLANIRHRVRKASPSETETQLEVEVTGGQRIRLDFNIRHERQRSMAYVPLANGRRLPVGALESTAQSNAWFFLLISKRYGPDWVAPTCRPCSRSFLHLVHDRAQSYVRIDL
jgi:hypothetical protein